MGIETGSIIMLIIGVLLSVFAWYTTTQNTALSKSQQDQKDTEERARVAERLADKEVRDRERQAEKEAQINRDIALKETLTELKGAVLKQTESYDKLSRSLDRIDFTVSTLTSTFARIEKESEHRFQDINHWLYHMMDQIGGLRDTRHDMGTWLTTIRLIFARVEKDDPRFHIEEQWSLPHMADLKEFKRKKEEQR